MISTRGMRCIPGSSAYMGNHISALNDSFHTTTNAGGKITLAVAENKCGTFQELLLPQLLREETRRVPPQLVGYGDMRGIMALKRSLADMLIEEWGVAREFTVPDEIVVASGCCAILEHLAYLLCDPGDGIIIPSPYYPAFDFDLTARTQAVIIEAPMIPPVWEITREILDFAHSSARDRGIRVRVLLISQPNNPLSKCHSRAEMQLMYTWAKENSIHLVSDEIYMLSQFSLGKVPSSPHLGMAEIAVSNGSSKLPSWLHIIYGFSKDFCWSGCRCGVVVTSNSSLLGGLANISQMSAVSYDTQHALAVLIGNRSWRERFVNWNREVLSIRAKHVCALLSYAGIDFIDPCTMFVWVDMRPLVRSVTCQGSKRGLTWKDEKIFSSHLYESCGVLMTPGSSCHSAEPGFFRCCFAFQSAHAVTESIRRIAAAFSPITKPLPSPLPESLCPIAVQAIIEKGARIIPASVCEFGNVTGKILDASLTPTLSDRSKLLARLQKELHEDFLPFWYKHGIDDKNGGFLCGLRHDGTEVDGRKISWYQGRGAWVWSHIYTNFDPDPRHLSVARKALKFVNKHAYLGSKGFLLAVPRDGRTVLRTSDNSKEAEVVDDGIDHVGYAGLFVAEGAQKLYRATKEAPFLHQAVHYLREFKALREKSTRRRPEEYVPFEMGEGYRTLGHQMIPLRICTQILRIDGVQDALSEADYAWLERYASSCVDAILNRFFQPFQGTEDLGLTLEVLRKDWTPDPRGSDFYYLGHAMEALWFCMDYADLKSNDAMFETAAARFRFHFEAAWDPLYGGLYRGMHGAHGYGQMDDKVAWVQQEGLVGLLMIKYRCKNKDLIAWSSSTFWKLYHWCDRYLRNPLRSAGHPLWLVTCGRRDPLETLGGGGDTFGTFGLSSRKENYHYPRFLMYAIQFLSA